jgi:hypothetical protein
MSAYSRTFTSLVLILASGVCISCGGGGTSGGGGGGGTPPPVPQTRLIPLPGNPPNSGLAGSSTFMELEVVDDGNFPVANSVVTFSSSTAGVEFYPSRETTTEFGLARTIVHLPNTVHSTLSITATTNTGGTYTGTVNTGMRVVRTYGTPSAATGVVGPDGTFFGGGTFNDISTVFNPDGSVRKSFASPYPSGKLPMSGHLPMLAPGGTLYYYDYLMLVPMDSNLNPLSPIDLYGRGGSPGRAVPAVGSDGKIYTSGCFDYQVHDSTGAIASRHALYFDVPSQVFIGDCYVLVNSSDNPVIYGRVGSDDYFIAEYDQNGKAIHFAHLPPQFGYQPSIVAKSNGNYVVQSADQMAELDSGFQVAHILFSPDPTWGSLAGIDSNSRYYFQSVRYGTWGSDPGVYWVCDETGQVVFSSGESDATTANYPMYNQAHIYNPQSATADPSTGTVYIASAKGISVYRAGAYVTRWPNAGGYSIAFSPSNEIYAISDAGATVFDLSGNLVRTLTYPQIRSSILLPDIAIDQKGNKFLFDTGIGTVHQIGPDDTYIKPITLPTGDYNGNARGLAATSDGALIVAPTNPGSGGTILLVEKIRLDGSLVWSKSVTPKVFGGFPRVDSTDRIYIGSLVLDSNGNTLSDVGFAQKVITPFGSHVVMLSDWTICELSAD